MKIWKNTALFIFGGTAYVLLELLWRGWSHISMFFAGGLCFLLLGYIHRMRPQLPLWAKAIMGALTITGVELAVGLLFNRDYSVWDYRTASMNFMGQICLLYSLLWIPVGLAGMFLFGLLDRKWK